MVTDPGTDNTLPASGALSWRGIASAVGVAGTTGADAKMVHGDRWQQVDGSQTETFLKDVTSTITGNQTRTVNGNQTFQTIGNVTRDIIGNLMTTVISAEIRANIGVQNYSHMAPKTRNHAGEELTSEVGAFYRSVQQQFEAHNSKLEASLVKIGFAATSMDFAGYKLAVCNIRTQPDPLRMEVSGLRVASRGLDNLMRAVRASVIATTLQVQAFEGDIQTRMQIPPESTMGIGVPLE